MSLYLYILLYIFLDIYLSNKQPIVDPYMDKESLKQKCKKKFLTNCRRVSLLFSTERESVFKECASQQGRNTSSVSLRSWCESRFDSPLSHSLHVSVHRFMQPCRGFETAAKMSPCITAECQSPNTKNPQALVAVKNLGTPIYLVGM